MVSSAYIKNNISVILVLSLLIFGLSFYANISFLVKSPEGLRLFPPFIKGVDLNYNEHLGAEYYFIAKAITSGKGFSNPFQEDTGPTAWMPPVYPFLLALLIKIFKTKYGVSLAVLFLKNVVLIFTGTLIYEIAKRTLTSIKAGFILAIYAVWLISFFRWFFQITHDVWIILFFIDIIFLLAIKMWSNPSNKNILVTWGIVGGLATLTNPVLGLVWLLILISIFRKVNKHLLIISLIISVAITSIWIVRNYIVFGRFILVKSNLYYDAYQSNYVKDDGMPNEAFFGNHLVWVTKGASESEYKKLREGKFMELYRERFLNKLSQEPYTFLRKIKNRLLAALLVYYPYNKGYEARFMAWKYFIHALPFCSLPFILLFRKEISHYVRLAILIYGVFLIPYILISYYIRYSLPLTPLQNLFIFWGADSFYGKIKCK
jgi:hypothetical protein